MKIIIKLDDDVTIVYTSVPIGSSYTFVPDTDTLIQENGETLSKIHVELEKVPKIIGDVCANTGCRFWAANYDDHCEFSIRLDGHLCNDFISA